MTFKKRYLRLVHLLFIVLLLIQLLPDKLSGDTYAQYVVWFAVGVEILTLIVSSFIKKPIGLTLFVDIVSFIYGLLIAWTLATAKFNLLKPALFPPPGRVFWQLIGDYEKIITTAITMWTESIWMTISIPPFLREMSGRPLTVPSTGNPPLKRPEKAWLSTAATR